MVAAVLSVCGGTAMDISAFARMADVGAFLMQFMVQGAWGAIPAHLVELSPSAVRGLFSGLAYQLGVLFASNAAFVEALIAQHLGYARALAIVASTVLTLDAIVIALGHERKGSDLHAA